MSGDERGERLRWASGYLLHGRGDAVLRAVPDVFVETGEHGGELWCETGGDELAGHLGGRDAAERGELPDDLDFELALDLLAAPIYWRMTVRQAPIEADYLDHLADHILRAPNARSVPRL
ncbi:TetR/AcrR family transcriptional regulator C-terminal ligand-binding domain-containing protein [Kibdelosporangium philippinense]|uniref:TetR/AcrR family transcriptional regulator C-terminal ligand-binding domain-containing protein n=1 Tax=Kibdelosporangium philippinense TaxID=211113 RepID=A0ABS8Z994_9PSEU|nr:TetR-like C-terminal domain-containing protein [Kibdelosporangium philippinense]MCE7003669.1 TetR/AcrR family transcriptional regulator C-terminal ligand-binding domain-containing protein [Kibdelosporangium philippinense]